MAERSNAERCVILFFCVRFFCHWTCPPWLVTVSNDHRFAECASKALEIQFKKCTALNKLDRHRTPSTTRTARVMPLFKNKMAERSNTERCSISFFCVRFFCPKKMSSLASYDQQRSSDGRKSYQGFGDGAQQKCMAPKWDAITYWGTLEHAPKMSDVRMLSWVLLFRVKRVFSIVARNAESKHRSAVDSW